MSIGVYSDYGTDEACATPIGAPPRTRWSRRVAIDIVAGLDTLSLLAGFGLGTVIHRGAFGFAGNHIIAALELCLMSAAVGHFVLRQLGQYEVSWMPGVRIGWGELALMLFLVFATVQSVAFTLGAAQAFPRGWPMVSLAFGGAILLGLRASLRAFLAPYAASGMFDANLAVYGAGRIANRVVGQIMAGDSGLRLVGVYDDRSDPNRLDSHGAPVAGGLAELIEAGRADNIDEIIIALPQSADRRIADIARRLEHLPVRIRICTHIASDLVDANLTRNKVSNVGPVGLLDVKAKPLENWAPVFKRLEDIAIGLPALVVFLPLMLVIAAAIRLDSPGPVLFRQKRGGLNHRVFEVLKFRTMRVMEQGAAVTQASRDDPRVTRLGRILRRTSLDELPQLVNIVLGDMSLVGPRPHALVHDQKYGEMLERYANRHQVKPGLTGWAQINGFRGETQTPEDMRARVEYDLAYIDHWSLLNDLKILAMTPFFGFAGRNAF